MSTEDKARAARNLAKLPILCYAFHEGAPAGKRIIQVRAGERGMYVTTLDQAAMTATEAHQLIDFLNARLGVSYGQREAMVSGSMFGWHTTSADSDLYVRS